MSWSLFTSCKIALVFSYFINRNILKIEHDVPQGSSLGPLLFYINSIDIFYEYEDSNIGNYNDDTTPCTCGSNNDTVISELQIRASKLF